MAIYDYECEQCKHEFENINKVDDANPLCPLCGFTTQRLISPCGWHLNGDGWYNPHSPNKRSRGGCPKKK